MANYDDMRLAVQMLSGGKNDVLFDDVGVPGVYVVFPKFKISDVMDGGSDTIHPAFVVDGVEKNCVYISKYQNIVAGGRAYSLPFRDPAQYITFDNSKSCCDAKGTGFHMMTNAEWAAVALWCRKNGFIPHGNNHFGADIDHPWERGVETSKDGENTVRTATGSGPVTWSHDGTTTGIYDLNGNIWECVGGMRLSEGEIQIIPDAAINGADMSPSSELWQAIMPDGSIVAPGTAGTLHFDSTSEGDATQTDHDVGGAILLNTTRDNPQYTGDATSNPYYGQHGQTFESLAPKSGVTVPEILKSLALMPDGTGYNGDYLWLRNYGERLLYRGGFWGDGAGAGLFGLNLSARRSGAWDARGFRSAFI